MRYGSEQSNSETSNIHEVVNEQSERVNEQMSAAKYASEASSAKQANE